MYICNVCMHVCNVCMYVMYVMYVCMYVCMHVCMYVCMYVCVCGEGRQSLRRDIGPPPRRCPRELWEMPGRAPGEGQESHRKGAEIQDFFFRCQHKSSRICTKTLISGHRCAKYCSSPCKRPQAEKHRGLGHPIIQLRAREESLA